MSGQLQLFSCYFLPALLLFTNHRHLSVGCSGMHIIVIDINNNNNQITLPDRLTGSSQVRQHTIALSPSHQVAHNIKHANRAIHVSPPHIAYRTDIYRQHQPPLSLTKQHTIALSSRTATTGFTPCKLFRQQITVDDIA